MFTHHSSSEELFKIPNERHTTMDVRWKLLPYLIIFALHFDNGQSRLGSECFDDLSCAAAQGEICSRNICNCNISYFEYRRACFKKLPAGGSCSNLPFDACSDNSLCVHHECTCANGYYDSDGSENAGTCVRKIGAGGRCQDLPDAACTDNSACVGGVCTCNRGYTEDEVFASAELICRAYLPAPSLGENFCNESTSRSITLAWRAPVYDYGDIKHYVINSNTPCGQVTTPTNATWYKFVGLSPGTSYSFSVAAIVDYESRNEVKSEYSRVFGCTTSLAYSCKDIYAANPMISSGTYRIMNRKQEPYLVYCDFYNGYGYTYVATRPNVEINIDDLYTTNSHAMVRHLDGDGLQKEAKVEQLSIYSQDYSLSFQYNESIGYVVPENHQELGPYIYLGFLNTSIAALTTTQGYRVNGQDYTFINCDGNPNSYMAFFFNPEFRDPLYRGNPDVELTKHWITSAYNVPEDRSLPPTFYFFFSIHMGGCGGFLTFADTIEVVQGAALGLRFDYDSPCMNATCSNRTCYADTCQACKTAYAGLSETCGGSSTCIDGNADCDDDTFGVCRCNQGYYDNNGFGTSGRNAAGECNPMQNLMVTSVTLSGVSETEVNISWTPPTDTSQVSSYTIVWTVKDNPAPSGLLSVRNATAASIKGLTQATTYEFKVRSVEFGSRTSSQEVESDSLLSVTTLSALSEFCDSALPQCSDANAECTVPGGNVCRCKAGYFDNNGFDTARGICTSMDNLKVTEMKISDVGTDVATISWTPPDDESQIYGYRVSWKTGDNIAGSIFVRKILSAEITDLTPEARYTFTVSSEELGSRISSQKIESGLSVSVSMQGNYRTLFGVGVALICIAIVLFIAALVLFIIRWRRFRTF